VTPAQASAFNAVVEGFVAAHPSITLLDLQGRFCTADACSPKTTDGSARYRDDRVHFSTAGQVELGRWLRDRIAAGL
jgi:lysophospholipase L1-like esterase